MEITSLSQLDLGGVYNYSDYFSWKFKERVELFKGKIFQMSPAPSRLHQTISSDIYFLIRKHLVGNNCQVFYAPFDVRLERTKDDKKVQNIVQPDICVVCDLTKLDDRGCSGAPELVVEILSPGNTKKEMKYKFELYEAAGVLEYWIVDPTEKVVWQYNLQNGQYVNHKPLIEEDTLHSTVLQGFNVALTHFFS